MGTFRERQREVRQTEILASARRLLTENGYHNMAMDDLADQVGIAKATLYQHFSTKEDLVAAVLMQDMNRFVDYLTAAAGPARRPGERVAAALDWLLSRRHADHCADLNPVPEELFRLFHARPDFAASQQRCWLALATLVDAARAGGEFRAEIPTAVIVGLFFSVAVSHLFPLIVRDGLVSQAELTSALQTILFEGIAVKPAPVTTG